MKVLSIGDIHCRDNWKEVIDKHKDEVDKIIILGDIPDPYISMSHWEKLGKIYEVFDYFDENSEIIDIIWGNHDVHYLLGYGFKPCSRHDMQTYKPMDELYKSYVGKMKVAIKHDNYLWTHGGVSESWVLSHKDLLTNKYKLLSDYSNIDEVLNDMFLTEDRKYLYDCPPLRNGLELHGGPFWCDKKELYDERDGYNDLLPGFHQIVGHNKFREITTINIGNESVTFVDVLQYKTEGHILEL